MYLISLTSFWRGYCWNIKWFWIWTYLDLFWPFCSINPIYKTLTPWNPGLLVSETYFHNSASSLSWPSRFHFLILFSWFQVLPGYWWCPNPSARFTQGPVLSLPGQWRSPFGCPSLVFGWHSSQAIPTNSHLPSGQIPTPINMNNLIFLGGPVWQAWDSLIVSCLSFHGSNQSQMVILPSAGLLLPGFQPYSYCPYPRPVTHHFIAR